ncbi:MAG: hypothetical protein A2293_15775 [Elusimicrobia bacterium RIFOXYB2_FULL_49_7]|nr:MAG: hypothetical protein A2293_15775 [Elusimicrobia bacterium RIFOXYB2_FULL_49_7]
MDMSAGTRVQPGYPAVSDAPPTFNAERVFLFIAFLSFLIHLIFAYFINQVDIKKIPQPTIDELPQRIVKILMDKPRVPEKKKKEAVVNEKAVEDISTPEKKEAVVQKEKAQRKVAAQKNVAKRAAKVEQELRTSGMLALLTGKGPSRSMGRSAVDVLGGASVKNVDLDAALKNVSGIRRAGSEADMQVQLTTKKVVASEKVSIEQYVQSFGSKDKSLDKLGSIEITKPKTVGTASTSAKRDDRVIGDYVKTNMRSIKAAYDRLLKNKPDLAGKITIRFTIESSGRVVDVEVVESSMEDSELIDKIIRVVRNWRFPEISESEGSVTVNFPFIFQPK